MKNYNNQVFDKNINHQFIKLLYLHLHNTFKHVINTKSHVLKTKVLYSPSLDLINTLNSNTTFLDWSSRLTIR